MNGREVVIAAAVRTPVGRGHPEKGVYRNVHPNVLLGSTFVPLEGSGHGPHGRDPVKVNLILRDLVCPPTPSTWVRGRSRPKLRTTHRSARTASPPLPRASFEKAAKACIRGWIHLVFNKAEWCRKPGHCRAR